MKKSSAQRSPTQGRVWRLITLAFITASMVDCILYCLRADRPFHLHWLSYCRWLDGSGEEYEHEMPRRFDSWAIYGFLFLKNGCYYFFFAFCLAVPVLCIEIVKFSQVTARVISLKYAGINSIALA